MCHTIYIHTQIYIYFLYMLGWQLSCLLFYLFRFVKRFNKKLINQSCILHCCLQLLPNVQHYFQHLVDRDHPVSTKKFIQPGSQFCISNNQNSHVAFERDRKRWKSVGAKSGEYDGCGSTSHSSTYIKHKYHKRHYIYIYA